VNWKEILTSAGLIIAFIGASFVVAMFTEPILDNPIPTGKDLIIWTVVYFFMSLWGLYNLGRRRR